MFYTEKSQNGLTFILQHRNVCARDLFVTLRGERVRASVLFFLFVCFFVCLFVFCGSSL